MNAKEFHRYYTKWEKRWNEAKTSYYNQEYAKQLVGTFPEYLQRNCINIRSYKEAQHAIFKYLGTNIENYKPTVWGDLWEEDSVVV